jgi:hypothetical protein
MRYLLMIYCDENAWEHMSPEEQGTAFEGYNKLTTNLSTSSKLGASDALQPTSTATVVRVRGGEVLTTDGPYAETKEQLGGFYLVDAANLDEAVQWAAQVPVYGNMAVEIRPIMEFN